MRLAIVTNILTPYRQPLYQALSERVQSLQVYLMAANEPNRSWRLPPPRFPCEVLPGLHVRMPWRDSTWHLNFGVASRLAAFKPDVVLSGGFSSANFSALRFCRRSGSAFVSFGAIASTGATGLVHARRGYIVSRSDGWIGFCSAAGRRFEALGADAEHMLCQPNPAPIERYHAAARRGREKHEGQDMLAGLTRPILMTASRVVTEKGYPELLDLFARVVGEMPSASLVVLGDGRDLDLYRRQAKARFANAVKFVGFVAPEEVPALFAEGDAFVFPTRRDTFGVVLAEAMACGLPVVASVRAGATEDLVEEGVTGFRIDATRTDAAAAQVIRALRLPPRARQALVDEAYRRVRQWDCVPSAARMVDYLESVVRRKRCDGT